jgi:hypothetical protein
MASKKAIQEKLKILNRKAFNDLNTTDEEFKELLKEIKKLEDQLKPKPKGLRKPEPEPEKLIFNRPWQEIKTMQGSHRNEKG